MKHFLRDVLAGFLASLLAALAAHQPRPGRGADSTGALTLRST